MSLPEPMIIPERKFAGPNSAAFTMKAGPVRLSGKVRVSTAGLIGLGGLVSSILLSTAAIVWVATTPDRRHPITTRLSRR